MHDILQARLQVPDLVLQQMRELNNLDIELYKYAEDIFAKQSEHTMRKLTTEVSLDLCIVILPLFLLILFLFHPSVIIFLSISNFIGWFHQLIRA